MRGQGRLRPSPSMAVAFAGAKGQAPIAALEGLQERAAAPRSARTPRDRERAVGGGGVTPDSFLDESKPLPESGTPTS